MMGRNNTKTLRGASTMTFTIVCAIMACAIMTILPNVAEAQETDEERLTRLTGEFRTAQAAVRIAEENVTTARDTFRAADRAFSDGSGTRDDRQEALRELRQAQQRLQEARIRCEQARRALNRLSCGPECQRQRRLQQQRRRQQAEEPPPVEVCDNGLDDDRDGDVDCADSDCADHESCQPDDEEEDEDPPPREDEICDDGIDNDHDGLVDRDDDDCPAEVEERRTSRRRRLFHAIFWPTLIGVLTASGVAIGCAVSDDHCGMRDERTDINVRVR